ncbi:MAG TPA: hypothetical protein VNZ05_01520, partial [Solirubrobacteraceae bacterium]|nr:hypothetical protein [Solirubrobacteraceae bacterium]
ALHAAAEWTSMRDRAFQGRLACAAFVVALAAAGGAMRPVVFMAILAVAFVAQLVLELVTYPLGAASVVPPRTAFQAQESASS